MSPYLGDLTKKVHTFIEQDNEFNARVCVICTCMYVLVSFQLVFKICCTLYFSGQ